MADFVYLPRELYKGNPYWVPPIWSDERNAYRASTNPILENSDFILLVAYRDGKPVGRNLVYVDRTYNAFFSTKTALFGAFECEDDDEAADALFSESERWARSCGMNSLLGPIHPVAENWGFLLTGYDLAPAFMTPYTPPYYHRFLEKRGYCVAKDTLAYEADGAKGYGIPDRYERFIETVLSREKDLTVRKLRMKNLKDDAKIIFEISNAAYVGNWGYVPVNLDVLDDMVDKLKLIVDPDAIWFVEKNGVPVGYAFGYPDMNVILKKIRGNLLPFGFIRFLRDRRRLHDYRLFGLAVLPEYQNHGYDVLLYMKLYEALAPRKIRLEANYILEDNWKIRNALERLGMTRVKSYRIYERNL